MFIVLAHYSKHCPLGFLNFLRFLMQFVVCFRVSLGFFQVNKMNPVLMLYPILVNFVLPDLWIFSDFSCVFCVCVYVFRCDYIHLIKRNSFSILLYKFEGVSCRSKWSLKKPNYRSVWIHLKYSIIQIRVLMLWKSLKPHY